MNANHRTCRLPLTADVTFQHSTNLSCNVRLDSVAYKSWTLVEIAVVSPPSTVSGGTDRAARLVTTALLLLILFAGVLYGWHDSPNTRTQSRCEPNTTYILDTKACTGCENNTAITHLGTAITFPRMDLVDSYNGETVTVNCSSISERLVGSVHRTCFSDGWGPVNGVCKLRECPVRMIALPGLPSSAVPRLASQQCQHQVDRDWQCQRQCQLVLQNSLTLAPAQTELDRVIECPSPGYRGNFIAKCDEDGRWTDMKDNCERLTCPATWIPLNVTTPSGLLTIKVQLPRQQRIDTHAETLHSSRFNTSILPWQVVPCCSTFSNTGSCIDKNGGAFGSIFALCDRDGVQHTSKIGVGRSGNAQTLHCQPASEIKSRLDVHNVSISEKMYNAFLENMQQIVTSATAGKWRLPSAGIISSVSMATSFSQEHQFVPVVSGDAQSLDARMPVLTDQQRKNRSQLSVVDRIQLARGRSAAAFAQVYLSPSEFDSMQPVSAQLLS